VIGFLSFYEIFTESFGVSTVERKLVSEKVIRWSSKELQEAEKKQAARQQKPRGLCAALALSLCGLWLVYHGNCDFLSSIYPPLLPPFLLPN
jgi:hypothetical protein